MNDETKEMLVIAMEESAEIAQACSKAIRFGVNNHHPGKSSINTHANEIMTEFFQLQAIIEDLQKKNILPKYTGERVRFIKREKLDKVKKFMEQKKEKNYASK